MFYLSFGRWIFSWPGRILKIKTKILIKNEEIISKIVTNLIICFKKKLIKMWADFSIEFLIKNNF